MATVAPRFNLGEGVQKLGRKGGIETSTSLFVVPAGDEERDFEEHNSNIAASENEEDVEESYLDSQEGDEEVAELPEELASLARRKFETEEELQSALDELGCADYRIELSSEGYAYVMAPNICHNLATTVLHNNFVDWQKGWFGRKWGVATSTIGLELSTPTANTRRKTRDPDVSLWGFPKCTSDPFDGDLIMTKLPAASFPGATKDRVVDPDVVIQFSWKNTKNYEIAALNDLMNLTGVGNGNSPPRVGYLIKVRFASDSPVGFDIYKVPRGATVADAESNLNGAEHWEYIHGQADFVVEIMPSDLGVEGWWKNPPLRQLQNFDGCLVSQSLHVFVNVSSALQVAAAPVPSAVASPFAVVAASQVPEGVVPPEPAVVPSMSQ